MKKKNTIIIAEAGVNHNGNLTTAKKLVKIASKAGADIVKFQSFFTKNLVTKFARKASYQKKKSKLNESQYNMLKPLELSKKDHYKLINFCKKLKIEFLSTAFDIESVSFFKRYVVKVGESATPLFQKIFFEVS